MKWIKVTAVLVVTLLVGVGIGYKGREYTNRGLPFTWYTLGKPAKGGVGFAIDVLFNQEIPPPGFNSITGKAKFVPSSDPSASGVSLGYKITVDTQPADMNKVPDKYKKDAVIDERRGITQLGIKTLRYEVEFTFTLLDKDSFHIYEVKSAPEQIKAGEVDHLKGLTAPTIPASVAQRTSKIVFGTGVNKSLDSDSQRADTN
jgi:hypothetical protein